MLCQNCQTELRDGVRFCGKCGASAVTAAPVAAPAVAPVVEAPAPPVAAPPVAVAAQEIQPVQGTTVEITMTEAERNALVSAAQSNDPQAQFTLGDMIAHGQDFPMDHAAAAQWYSAAAGQDHAGAQAALGYSFEHGRGVGQDISKAVKLYTQSAYNGNAEGQFFLGNCYVLGQGVEQNFATAAQWFEAAAMQGDMESQGVIGTFYKGGVGVAQDLAVAEQWFRRAAEQGHDASKQELLLLKEGLPDAPGSYGGNSGGNSGSYGNDKAGSHENGSYEQEPEHVFAYWPDDGYYYPATVEARGSNTVDVLFRDGVRRQAGINEVLGLDSVFTMQAESNWEHKGYYYPCQLYVTDDDRLEVVYDEDGVIEVIDTDQLRLRY